ncbi:tail fiber domain-containing protein [Tenacibaculum mesophilum]|uniref:tail fiber domain-containing protein n=1 Tax=Tenacibaculum mesophilum TaxID=104268 RepID=UPI002491D3B9|nr:tail fiber domain-containing protein [Tenacibaculum mesophilum]
MTFNETINTGTTPGDGKGAGLRTNMRKLIENDNYLKEELDNVFEYNFNNEANVDVNRIKFKTIKLPTVTGYDFNFLEKVILLIPVSSTVTGVYNRILGNIITAKYASNIWDCINVTAQSTYNSTVASFDAIGQNYAHKLVTCTYNEVNWLALKLSQKDNPRFEYYFNGFHQADEILDINNDALKVVPYFKFSTNEVVNAEINDSIQDYVGVSHRQITSKLHVEEEVHCTALFQTSDKRFKTNIEPIEGEWALEIFKKLNFSFYDFSKTNSKQAGLIAQEVGKILPQAVYTSSKGDKALNYNYIDIVCKAAIQHFIKSQIQ